MARNKMIMVRVDEAEHALFKEAARGVGISMSEYARDAMLARMALEQAPVSVAPVVPVVVEAEPDPEPWVISSPADVPAAVERVAPSRTSEFTPYSKEQSAGKAQKKSKAVPWDPCRHGLLRCKVCGTG